MVFSVQNTYQTTNHMSKSRPTCKTAQSLSLTRWVSTGNSLAAYPPAAAPLPWDGEKDRLCENVNRVVCVWHCFTPVRVLVCLCTCFFCNIFYRIFQCGCNLRVAKPWSQQGRGCPGECSRGSCVLSNHSRVWARRDEVRASRGPTGPKTRAGSIRFTVGFNIENPSMMWFRSFKCLLHVPLLYKTI